MKNTSKQFENQLAKDKAGKTGAEIRAFAAESKMELSPETLEMVNGGMQENEARFGIKRCRNCGSTNIQVFLSQPSFYGWAVRCKDCGWSIS